LANPEEVKDFQRKLMNKEIMSSVYHNYYPNKNLIPGDLLDYFTSDHWSRISFFKLWVSSKKTENDI
jgi:hypothetical protein